MPRIYTDQISTGKPLNIFIPASVNNGFADTAWTELAEAPDFSIPALSAEGVADFSYPEREIRSGEIYFESPLIASNSTSVSRWVQLEVVLPTSGGAFETGAFIPAGAGGGASGRVFMAPRLSTTARLYDVATDTLLTPNGVFPANAFMGCVRMNDNRIYMIPFGGGINQKARIYNPVTDTFSTPNGVFPLNNGQYTGVLLADGKVFILPFNDTVARIYDPVADSLSVAGGTYPANAHYTAVRLASGKLFMPPTNAGRAAVYDPVANTRTEVGPVYGSNAFIGAVLLNDGKVFMVPYAESLAAIYDPAGSGTVTPVNATNWGQPAPLSYFNGARLPDGRVYMPGAAATEGRIWDPATDTSTVPAGRFSGDADFRGLVTLADGRIYLIPHNAVAAKIYSSAANTLSTPAGNFPSVAERIAITGQLAVPGNGTISIPIQGQRLLSPARSSEAQGGKLLVRAEVNNAIRVFGSAIELEAATHAPSTEL